MSLNLNTMNLFKNDLSGSRSDANPFKNGVVNPFKQDINFKGISGGPSSHIPQNVNPLSDLQEIAKAGSAFSADGGIGRKIEGGMYTPAGMAGQRLQLFA